MFNQQILLTHHLTLLMLKHIFLFLMLLTRDVALNTFWMCSARH